MTDTLTQLPMTPQEEAAILKYGCEWKLRQFVKEAWNVVEPGVPLQWNWHLDCICDHLQAVTEGQIRRLLITVPPRHGKSLMVSVFWPCWTWIKNPAVQWMFSSYAHDLALRDSVKCRRLILSDWYQGLWGDQFKFMADQNAKERFDTDKMGYRLATSVGGQLTGHGAQIIAVDDAHNAIEGESDAVRESTLEWWDRAMSTRLNDPKTGAYVIIQQRLHERDLVGHILEKEGEHWDHVNLPARYEKDHPCPFRSSIGWEDNRTQEGELLWPERMGEPEVKELEQRLGTYGASGQLQQRPSPSGGGMFKRQWFGSFRDKGAYYELIDPEGAVSRVPKSECWRLATADTAQTDTDTADYSVRVVFDVTPDGRMIFVDLWREQAQAPDVEHEMRRTISQWRPSVLGIEEKQAGQGTVQRLQREGLPVQGLKAPGDKVARATTAAIYTENGRAFLPEQADWLDVFMAEVTRFPRGAHDDIVDTFAHGANLVANRDQWRPVVAEFSAVSHDEGGHIIPAPEVPDYQNVSVYMRLGVVAAALLVTVDQRSRLIVLDERYEPSGSVHQLAEQVENMIREWQRDPESIERKDKKRGIGKNAQGVDRILTDPEADSFKRTNAQTPAQQVRLAGIEVGTWPNADSSGWQARIQATREALRNHTLLISERCERLSGELRTWRHKQQQNTGDALADKYEGPDHGVRCLLAWVGQNPADDEMDSLKGADFDDPAMDMLNGEQERFGIPEIHESEQV